ncbi:MAG: DUF309 domain-containing protein [bacterium]|nr:DUF309 domain-containing protein [bacterium]
MTKPDRDVWAYAEFARLWNSERYFEAHEVLEDRWRVTSDPGERALIQCAAALLHLRRGNLAGAMKLLRAAAVPLEAFARHRPSLRPLLAWLRCALEQPAPDAAQLARTRPPLPL